MNSQVFIYQVDKAVCLICKEQIAVFNKNMTATERVQNIYFFIKKFN